MFRFTPLCLALLLALPDAAHAQAGTQQNAPAGLVQVDLPAQPLESAINALARQANVSVAVNLPLVRGRQADALAGRFSVQESFDRLLRGSGLQAQVRGAIVTIRRHPGNDASVSTLMPVTVHGRSSPRADIFATPDMRAVVTQEDLQRLPPRNVSDTLANVSGVFTSQGRADPGVSVNIWGMQDFGRVNVMIDGTRQNFQKSGHGINGQVYLDPALISQVDVSKGPSSTVGGAGMIAGMVDFRTLEIDDILLDGKQVGARLQASSGSNAYHFVGNAAVGVRATDSLDLLAVVSRRNIGEFRLGRKGGIDEYEGSKPEYGYTIESPLGMVARATSQDTRSELFKLGWQPATDHQFQFSYLGFDTKFANGDRTDVSDNDARFQVRTQTFKLAYDFQPASPWIDLSSSLYYTKTHRKEAREVSATQGTPAFALAFKTSTVGGTLQNTAVMTREHWKLTSRTGGEFFHDWTDPQYNSNVDGSSRDAAWYVGTTPKGKRTVASAFQNLTLDYQDWLSLAMGLRLDRFWLSGNGQMYLKTINNEQGVRPPSTAIYTNFEVDRTAWDLAPTLSLAIKPTPWMQVFANYGRGLRPPAITEALMYGMHVNNMFPYYPNPGLKEERSRSWQFGMNLDLKPGLRPNDALRVKAAWFENRVENYIVLGAINSPVSTTQCNSQLCPTSYVNLYDPAKFYGLDLQLDYDGGDVFANLNLTRVLTQLDPTRYNRFPLGSWTGMAQNDGGQGTNAMNMFYNGPPKLKIGLTAGVRLLDRTLELGMRWRFEQPQQEDTLTVFANQTIRTVDVWAGWQVNRNLHLGLAVDNLLDRNYMELAGSGIGMNFAPGRTIVGTVTWKF